MSDSAKAVFLSYASQDAEAAKRIADALRVAGVEVWFDQSELVGGDAWDAKIRKQIAECALFVPIISAATQARGEGYFRLEWKLAVDRSHLMAHDQPFLLPVIIDATTDAAARVPPEFRAVQWTKLPGGETPPAFCARVQKLLEGAVSEDRGQRTEGRTSGSIPSDRSNRRAWLGPAIIAVAALGAVLFWQSWEKTAVSPAATKPAPPLPEARKLEQQARALIDDDPLAVRENYRTAYELCQRAVALSPDDGEIWATLTRANINLIWNYAESSDQKRAAARTEVERATRLAPQSFESDLAMAVFELQAEENTTAAKARLLRLLERNPKDPRVLRLLINVEEVQGQNVAEAERWLARATALPGGDPLALVQMAWVYWVRNQLPEVLALVDQSLALKPTADGYHLKLMALYTSGDLAAARNFLQQIPSSVLREDRVVMIAYEVRYLSHEPDAALAVLAGFPREILEEGRYFGLRGYLAGRALQVAGKARAAEVEYRAALKALDQRIGQNPHKASLLFQRARLLACLGDREEAARQLDTARELGRLDTARELQRAPMADIQTCVLLGRVDEALAAMDKRIDRRLDRWPSDFLVITHDPIFEPLKPQSRFQTIVARGEAWMREVMAGQAKSSEAVSLAPKTDDKSVAVLAFANLSDDKANEYFSDGISEELLNVLAKVPGLKVTARTSAFHFKGKDTPIPEIARQLGVAYVVEGSVRKQGDKVRITAQLIKAADGFHVWSDTFTRDLKDIFAVQDEIAGLVAKSLQLQLAAGDSHHDKAIDLAAWQLYLDGRRAWNLRTMEGYREAETLFQRAIGIDARFARAYAALADVWQIRAIDEEAETFSLRWRTTPAAIKSRALIDKALEIDPHCAEAYASLGMNLQLSLQDEPGLQAYRRAVELNPNYATAHQWLGLCSIGVGEVDEAQIELTRAAELDPLSHRILSDYAKVLIFAGRPEQALAVSRRALSLQPGAIQAVLQKARALALLGQPLEAVAVVEELDMKGLNSRLRGDALTTLIIAKQPEAIRRLIGDVDAMPASTTKFASLVALGRIDEAFANHDSGIIGNSWSLIEAAYGPLFAPVREDLRFQRMIEASGRAEYFHRAQAWRAAHPPEKPAAK